MFLMCNLLLIFILDIVPFSVKENVFVINGKIKNKALFHYRKYIYFISTHKTDTNITKHHP